MILDSGPRTRNSLRQDMQARGQLFNTNSIVCSPPIGAIVSKDCDHPSCGDKLRFLA